jgi:hypothetical protein
MKALAGKTVFQSSVNLAFTGMRDSGAKIWMRIYQTDRLAKNTG